MAAPVQAGDDVILGFGDLAISAYVAEDGLSWKKGYGSQEDTKDQNGATRSKIRMDVYEELSGTFILDDPTGTTKPPALTPGDVITVVPPDSASAVWEVQDATTALAAGATKLTMTIRKEASMTYAS